MSNKIVIQSHKGEYTTSFIRGGMDQLNDNLVANAVYIIDRNICKLYADRIDKVLSSPRIMKIDATEENKSLEKIPGYVRELVSLNIRRGNPLIAIGGGIVQDITCFLATTVMRGLPWIFYPTTLLAQSDSCIGSKSSINSGEFKNILGTFLPPEQVVIDVDFLQTLKQREIFSGVGEMLKVHAINNPESFNQISEAYEKILDNPAIMEEFIYNSLSMKKKLIEVDEFDQGPRNVMNYGHSFGHAIESATDYGIPHGIAVTIGMDIANFISVKLGILEPHIRLEIRELLQKIWKGYNIKDLDVETFCSALAKDKKNVGSELRLILCKGYGKVFKTPVKNDEHLQNWLAEYFNKELN